LFCACWGSAVVTVGEWRWLVMWDHPARWVAYLSRQRSSVSRLPVCSPVPRLAVTCLSNSSANSSHTYMRCSRLIAATFTARWLRHFPHACIVRFLSAPLHSFHLIHSLFHRSQFPSLDSRKGSSRIRFLRVCYADILRKSVTLWSENKLPSNAVMFAWCSECLQYQLQLQSDVVTFCFAARLFLLHSSLHVHFLCHVYIAVYHVFAAASSTLLHCRNNAHVHLLCSL